MLCQACPVILGSSTEHPPTALPLHYPLAAGCVLIFVLDLWRHQSAVFSPRTFLEHFATCFVLLPTPPRYGGTTPGPASGPPSRATRCPSTHPILVYCVLCSAVYPALLCPALSRVFIEFVPFNMVAFPPVSGVFPFSFLNPGAVFMLAFRTINSFDTYPAAK